MFEIFFGYVLLVMIICVLFVMSVLNVQKNFFCVCDLLEKNWILLISSRLSEWQQCLKLLNVLCWYVFIMLDMYCLVWMQWICVLVLLSSNWLLIVWIRWVLLRLMLLYRNSGLYEMLGLFVIWIVVVCVSWLVLLVMKLLNVSIGFSFECLYIELVLLLFVGVVFGFGCYVWWLVVVLCVGRFGRLMLVLLVFRWCVVVVDGVIGMLVGVVGVVEVFVVRLVVIVVIVVVGLFGVSGVCGVVGVVFVGVLCMLVFGLRMNWILIGVFQNLWVRLVIWFENWFLIQFSLKWFGVVMDSVFVDVLKVIGVKGLIYVMYCWGVSLCFSSVEQCCQKLFIK